MSASPPLFVVLAAGKGTRMRSAEPKVLHKIAGRSMLAHVLKLQIPIDGAGLVVVGPDMEAVASETRACGPGAEVFVQAAQRGTADAVLAARSALDRHSGDVIVLYADTPLIRPETLKRLQAALDAGANIAVLGFRPNNPTGYGRLVTDSKGSFSRSAKKKTPAKPSGDWSLQLGRHDVRVPKSRTCCRASAMPMPRANSI